VPPRGALESAQEHRFNFDRTTSTIARRFVGENARAMKRPGPRA